MIRDAGDVAAEWLLEILLVVAFVFLMSSGCGKCLKETCKPVTMYVQFGGVLMPVETQDCKCVEREAKK